MEIRNKLSKHFLKYVKDWNFMFYVIFGGYGSGKSYTTAMKLLSIAFKEKRKILVVRNVARTHRESTFALLKRVLRQWGLYEVCKVTSSRLSITLPNGSEFVFEGGDDPEKLKSIDGVSIVWIEEATELPYEVFNELIGRLRDMSATLHIILTFNPVAKSNWTYKHFIELNDLNEFDAYNKRIIKVKDIFIHHSTVADNRHVPIDYKERLKNYEAYNPDLYRIAYLGHFGIVGKQVFTNVHSMDSKTILERVSKLSVNNLFDGLDYGFAVSKNALVRMAVDRVSNILYIYTEMYNKELITSELIEELKKYIQGRYRKIIADNARPEITEEIRRSRIRIESCKKGQGSVKDGLSKLQNFSKIYISEDCPNAYREFTELCHLKDKNGDYIEEKFTIDPHTVDAARYGLEEFKHVNLKHGRVNKPKGL